ncbi:hypothetical protein NU219Hw_g9317t1 [Hortaea werneckii]
MVEAHPSVSAVHTRQMTYSIPAGHFHRTEVAPGELHATLFYFDSSRGFLKDAPVLGPKDAKDSIQIRDPKGATPAVLATHVQLLRSWESLVDQGRRHVRRSELEFALRAFTAALEICESPSLLNVTEYRHVVLCELGYVNRGFGRYEEAREILEKVLGESERRQRKVEVSGELGVVYRHMGCLEDARRAFEIQYDIARSIKSLPATCRAVGNLGMVNYQLSQQIGDDRLLDVAIQQLNERVDCARAIQNVSVGVIEDKSVLASKAKYGATREAIGLARLSLCHSAKGDMEKALDAASKSLAIAQSLEETTVLAMSCLFYGLALLQDGQRKLALHYLNPSSTPCTPAIALCKEPSEEHRQYLQKLVDVGADMGKSDEHGYTALDYAVFNGDTVGSAIILSGIVDPTTREGESVRHGLLVDAKLRKGYRQVFQEQLRPILKRRQPSCLQNVHRVYANAMAADPEKSAMFEKLKYVKYADLTRHGRFPRSSDGITQTFATESTPYSEALVEPFILFISYRWVTKTPWHAAPDDDENTQYRRTISAAEEFLELHPEVKRERLGVWIVRQ